MSRECQPDVPGFFRQSKQKAQGILCVFPSISAKDGGNKTGAGGGATGSELP